jgi:hypothetical protein
MKDLRSLKPCEECGKTPTGIRLVTIYYLDGEVQTSRKFSLCDAHFDLEQYFCAVVEKWTEETGK